MPYTIKTQQIAVKDPDTGEYSGVDVLTEQTTEGLLNEIEVAGTNQVTNVQNAGAATVALVNNTVSQSQTAVDNLQQQRDDIVTSVTDTLSKGVDNSLTTPSMPAEAKAVGDLYETIVVDSETQPNKRWNRVWVKPATEEVEIPTMDEIRALNDDYTSYIGSLTLQSGLITSENKWYTRNDRQFIIAKVPSNVPIIIEIEENANLSLAFLKSFSYTAVEAREVPDYCTSTPERITINKKYSGMTPSDCNYIYVLVNNGTQLTIKHFIVDGYELTVPIVPTIKAIEKDLDEQVIFTEDAYWKLGFITTNKNEGDIIDLNVDYVLNDSYYYTSMSCTAGDKFLLYGLGGNAARLWTWLDASGRLILPNADSSVEANPIILTAPENASLLICNSSKSHYSLLKASRNFASAISERMVVYENTAEMIARFKERDYFCYVIDDDGDYCKSYRGNYYRYFRSDVSILYGLTFDEYTLESGGKAKLVIPPFTPLKSNYECIDTIIQIANSYCGKGIKYVAQNGPFSTDKFDGIQCSQFVNCLLQGLPYEQSKLANPSNTNELLDGGCRWVSISDNNTSCLSAHRLAHFAAAHGWLVKTKQLRYTEPGDLIFFKYNTTQYLSVDWEGITHVVMVVGRIGSKTIFVQAGGITSFGVNTSTQYRPGDNTDAVNYQVIDDDKIDLVNEEFSMFGFARFPMTYHTKTQLESNMLDTVLDNVEFTDSNA